jgi:arginine exporter protein ArgO
MCFSRAEGILPYIPRHCKSGRLRSSAPAEPVVNAIVKWMGIVVLIGLALMYIEYLFAKKKKEGITPTDMKRIVGIFWLTIFFSVLVGGIMYLAD